MSNEKKQYCVIVKVYTWAEDKNAAIANVMGELDYLCELSDNPLNGYIHPRPDDVFEDTEI